jgi:GTP:adenosylcobinamide-phosphate guanylyltransferase
MDPVDTRAPTMDPPTLAAPEPYTAIVLAGSRGEGDALAEAVGTRHRALLEVCGVPMLLRVVRALRASPGVGKIIVSIDDPAALVAIPELRSQIADGSVITHVSRPSPSRSVVDIFGGLALDTPVLVTTADHALLTPAMVGHMTTGEAGHADLLVGVVAASRIQAAYPETKRTYLRLRDDAYSGANLFAFRTPAARRAAAFWQRAEQVRKQPWRLVGTFGPTTLLLFLTRRLDLAAAMERVSRAIGARVQAVSLPIPEAAIDVDRESDLALVTRIVRERESGAAGQSGRTPSDLKPPLSGS